MSSNHPYPKPSLTLEDVRAVIQPHNDRIVAEARLARCVRALRNLSNEVLGSVPLMEPLMRQEFGNTNCDLLIQRAEEARALLEELGPIIEY